MSLAGPAVTGHHGQRERRMLWTWWALAALAWGGLPWYLPQDLG